MLGIRMPIHWILKRIEQADAGEIDEIIMGLLKCYRKLYPDYELVVISLPKNNREERNAEIDRIAVCLKREYVRECADV